MKSKYFQILIYFFFASSIFTVEVDQKIVSLLDEKQDYSLNKSLHIIRTQNSQLKLTKIRNSENFFENKTEVPNYGFTKDTFWVRTQIRNETNTRDWYLQIPYPLLDKVEFYQLYENGKWMKTTTGSSLPFKKRTISERSFVFPVKLEANKINSFYFKIETDGVMQFPIYLYSHEKFLQKQEKENFAIGIYYGILGVLIIYNLILLFILKDSGYLYYLLFIISSAIAQSILNGIALQHFWPDTPFLASKSIPIMTALSLLFGLQFTRSFLNTTKIIPLLDNLILGFMFITFFFVFSPFLFSYHINIYFLSVLIVFFALIILFVAGVCLDKGYKPARYFLLAWTILIIGVGIYAFNGFGIISESIIVEFGLQIGSTLEMCLLSLGLAYKIRLANLHQLDIPEY